MLAVAFDNFCDNLTLEVVTWWSSSRDRKCKHFHYVAVGTKDNIN